MYVNKNKHEVIIHKGDTNMKAKIYRKQFLYIYYVYESYNFFFSGVTFSFLKIRVVYIFIYYFL